MQTCISKNALHGPQCQPALALTPISTSISTSIISTKDTALAPDPAPIPALILDQWPHYVYPHILSPREHIVHIVPHTYRIDLKHVNPPPCQQTGPILACAPSQYAVAALISKR